MNECVCSFDSNPAVWQGLSLDQNPRRAKTKECRQEGPGLQHVQWMQSKRDDPGPPKAAVTQEKWLEKMDKGQGSSRERCPTEMSLKGL